MVVSSQNQLLVLDNSLPTFRRTVNNKPSPEDPNDSFFSPRSPRSSTLFFAGARGTEWSATQHGTQRATPHAHAEGLSVHDASQLSDRFVSESWELPSQLRSNHGQSRTSLSDHVRSRTSLNDHAQTETCVASSGGSQVLVTTRQGLLLDKKLTLVSSLSPSCLWEFHT